MRTALFSHVRKHAVHGNSVRDVEMRKSGDHITLTLPDQGGQRQVLTGAPAYSITWGWLAANEMLMLELMR